MIERLRVTNFKRLRNIDCEMRPLTAVIGANGVGKTSLLDVLTLIGKSVKGLLGEFVMKSGGMGSILTRREGVSELSIGMKIPFERDPELEEYCRYEFALAAQGHSYFVARESMVGEGAGKPRPFVYIDAKYPDVRYWHYREMETASADRLKPSETFFSDAQMPYTPKVKDRLRCALYKASLLDVDGDIGKPQQLTPADSPGANGETLVSYLYNLRENSRDQYESYVFSIKRAFPNFESFSFPIVANGMVSLSWHESGLAGPLSAHQLSEGTLRFLWLAAVLASASSSLTLIDEPEISLHPELLRLLAALLREASTRSQIVVATHSDRLIGFLEPSEVAVMDRDEEGFATIAWADSMDLEEWLEDYTLDGLWRKGVLGGRAR